MQLVVGAFTDGVAAQKRYDYFELKPAPGKGYGAFATRAIKAGASVCKEYPLMTINKPSILVGESDIVAAYKRLSPGDKRIFDQSRHDVSHKQGCKCKYGHFSANYFGNSDWESPQMFPLASRFNHSCQPNTVWLTALSKDYHTLRTVKDVEEGEELTFCYSSDFSLMTTHQRQQELEKPKRNFQCACTHCALPLAQLAVSDMRRHLLRQLHRWLRKKDLDHADPAALNTTPDPTLVKNGVYSLLYAMLHESEGIVSGNDAHMAYALTAWQVLNVAYHEKVERIPARVVQDMRMWMQKSEQNIRLQYGDPEKEADGMWLTINMMMPFVDDDGWLDWHGLLMVKMYSELTFQMRAFSSVPP